VNVVPGRTPLRSFRLCLRGEVQDAGWRSPPGPHAPLRRCGPSRWGGHDACGARRCRRRHRARIGGPRGWGAPDRLGRVWSATGVRERAGAAGLGTPQRADHRPGGDPAPGQPPRAADRVAVRQPGRARRLRGGRGRRPWPGPGFPHPGPFRHRRLGPARRRRRQRPSALLRQRRRAGQLLAGPAGAHYQPRRAALPWPRRSSWRNAAAP